MTNITAVEPLDRSEYLDLLGILAGYKAVCEHDLESYEASTGVGTFLRQNTIDHIARLDGHIARLRAVLSH